MWMFFGVCLLNINNRERVMKKRTFYLSLFIVGICIPYISVLVCKWFNYDNSITIATITSISSIVVAIINFFPQKTNNNDDNSKKTNSGIIIEGKNKINGSVVNKHIKPSTGKRK